MDKISNVSSLKIKLDLPKVIASLYSYEHDPISQQINCALYHKSIHSTNLIYQLYGTEESFEREYKADKELMLSNKKNGYNYRLPYLKLSDSRTGSYIWLNDIYEIYDALDALYTATPLYYIDDANTQIDNRTLTTHINHTLHRISWAILLGNNTKLLPQSKNPNSRHSLYRKQMTKKIMTHYQDLDFAYKKATDALRYELLPFWETRITDREHRFMLGDSPYSADIALYSYLSFIKQTVERDMLADFAELQSYVEGFDIYWADISTNTSAKSTTYNANIKITL